MSSPLRFHISHFVLLILAIFSLSHPVRATDEKAQLLQDLNKYRSSLSLSALKENSNADCFADQIAKQYKSQPCSNTTGADTVPGTETQFSNYPDLLANCNLNTTNTRDGTVMPACVPNLDPSLVLTNYTETQYNGYLNDSKYTGAGINSEGNWMVVVLTTDTAGGSFAPETSLAPKIGVTCTSLTLLLGFFLVLVSWKPI
ncbi:uncharacterized GPI-anchored protein At5g19250-like [Macadamia integrifolia]|uniref:uncharacterized GPI-anchored protein At5g19250-like n=1 Tax=Macadamia integrifolia TaxID=60698 RepID=UPI001C4EBD05|nr:uncharacterized GPI-anchored protein At5g19250-like [Macadamia integrifolia]XP_042488450.1 uncharacterized GPI-anchored protein At5g19250-like [Macadamia integrifolia]